MDDCRRIADWIRRKRLRQDAGETVGLAVIAFPDADHSEFAGRPADSRGLPWFASLDRKSVVVAGLEDRAAAEAFTRETGGKLTEFATGLLLGIHHGTTPRQVTVLREPRTQRAYTAAFSAWLSWRNRRRECR